MRLQDKAKAVRYFESRVAFTAGPAEVEHMLKERDDVVIVDVRRPEDYEKGHIPHALNLPRDKWDTLKGLDRKKINVMYCYTQQCHAATEACLKFAREGFPVMELEGGWKAWREYGLEIEGAEELRKAA
jgi:rhodanese-related sulfurtransferase